MRLVLTGFMGTGKTQVGRLVATRLGRPFVDTDELVERAAGMSVREIFAGLGEADFRARERRAVEQACAIRNAIVATGGGALGDPVSFARLADASLMVCLTAAPHVIAARVRPTLADRPLLAGPDLIERIQELLAARTAVYARVSMHVDTSHLDVEQVAERVLLALARAERGEGPSDPSGTPTSGGESGP